MTGDHPLSLGEGNTPVTRSRHIGPQAGLRNLFFKLESVNPSGSYKDRFAAAAVGDMLAAGKTLCLSTSSGNTGSALAAYCAAARIACRIAIVETTPQGKTRQMLAHGAELHRVKGFGIEPNVTRQVFNTLQAWGAQSDAALQISAFACSPVGMSGVQSISTELSDQLDGAIAHVYVPAGGGGLTLAVARGFEDSACRPRVECVQPEGNDTIVTALNDGDTSAREVDCTTEISGLQVPSILDGHEVIGACRASGGEGHLVSDADVWAMQTRLAREEGIFCEPAGAVAVVGAVEAARRGDVAPDAVVVCLITGTGFKDERSLTAMTAEADCPLLDFASWASEMKTERARP